MNTQMNNYIYIYKCKFRGVVEIQKKNNVKT